MTTTGRYHGGLEFLGKRDSGLDRFSRIVTATLEAYGHRVERQSAISANEARITANRYAVQLELDPISGDERKRGRSRRNAETEMVKRRVTITLCAADPATDDNTQTQLMLVVMLYRMVEAYGALNIEWLAPDTVLSVEQFLSAFSNVSPRRVRGRQEIIEERRARFAPVDETAQCLNSHYDAICGQKLTGKEGLVSLSEDEALALAFREGGRPDEVTDAQEEAISDIRRLATWGMTGTLAFMSLPVAVSLAAVNLVRGEDFRLNTQALSLTGLLVVLQSSGALASAVSLLPI